MLIDTFDQLKMQCDKIGIRRYNVTKMSNYTVHFGHFYCLFTTLMYLYAGLVVIQVELMLTQLNRAKRRTDTQDIELAVDMMVVSSKTDERNADIAIIERLAKKLDLHTVEDLKIETIAVRNLAKKRGQTSESTQQIIELLDKFKQVVGMEVTNVLDDPVKSKTLAKSLSLVIPHEFLCPITLQIMRDPVIIANGQVIHKSKFDRRILQVLSI